ncbi:hypothetical protein ACFQAT_11405 [Undibacterium arcticum]|uniref:Uncharacterized protein n=1 Tax=Undibacterium arcticum TaxID=1762892 RepID=A0ABV7F949_9BURK
MKTTAHFKAVAILSICLAGAAAAMLTRDHAATPVASSAGSAAADTAIPTVTVVGKRLTTAEKALYDQQNGRLATRKAASRGNV